MRFNPIDKRYIPLLREECLDSLVRDFEVTQFSHCPSHISELERVLVFGKSRYRFSDFSSSDSLQCIGSGGFAWHIFDHKYTFRCRSGMTFLMTMPYDTHEGFHEKFDTMIREYYEYKNKLAQHICDPKFDGCYREYRTPGWLEQFAITERIDAVIVDDKYKIRENGDFAAIIATTGTLKKMGLT